MLYEEILRKRIKALCDERHYSVNYLSVISGVSQSTLDSIMHGSSKNPRVKTLHQIALSFNMTLSEFLDFPELNDYTFDSEDED